MAQSQGYKRFRSSINTVYHGTSTPQTSTSKIFPRASTPNPRSIDSIDQQTIPVVTSPHSKIVFQHKIHKKRRQHRSNYQIHIDHIVLIQQQKKPCSHCHCKKTKSKRILGIL